MTRCIIPRATSPFNQISRQCTASQCASSDTLGRRIVATEERAPSPIRLLDVGILVDGEVEVADLVVEDFIKVGTTRSSGAKGGGSGVSEDD